MPSTQLQLWSQLERAQLAAPEHVQPLPASSVIASVRAPELAERAQFYLDNAGNPHTRRAYERDMRAFSAWCAERSLPALPATTDTLALYLTELLEGGRKVSTVRRARVAIGLAHAATGLSRPDRDVRIRRLERGMARVHGSKEEGAPPLLHEHIVQITQNLRRCARADRDRVLLLVGFWGALRSSELAALQVEDLTLRADQLLVRLRRSKEDPLGRGAVVTIAAHADPGQCALRAVEAWLARLAERSGSLLRIVRGERIAAGGMKTRALSRIIHRLAVEVSLGDHFSSHSLRAGLATSAYARGVPEREIQAHGRWKDRRSLDRYIRPIALAARPNVVSAFG
jgi:site-specific recombinase XerD